MNPTPKLAPPPRDRLVRLSQKERPLLLVVIDTEEEFDWTKPFDRAERNVTHMRELGRLQSVFDECGVRPVYVIDHPIATGEESLAALRPIHAAGRCEIGAHLHPWVSPPFDEEVNARNSYPGNLPRALERAKLDELARVIERGFGARPRSYKAGRYGFGPNTASILAELGFEVDLSWCPAFDLGADGGPDYARFDVHPAWLEAERRVLAIPTTGAFVGFVRDGAAGLYELATRPSLSWAHLPGILSRIGALERLHLSPEGYSFEDNMRLTRSLLARGVRTFTFAVHSPSVLPGCTPYVQSVAERDELLDHCRRFLKFFLNELDGENCTALELRRRIETKNGTVPA